MVSMWNWPLDANNVYGLAVSQYLPYKGIKCLLLDNVNIDVTKIPINSVTGYILEVDLLYPKDLHDKHNDLYLAPVNVKLTE